MNRILDHIKNKKIKLVAAGAIVFIIYLLVSIASLGVMYPTEKHRAIGSQLTKMTIVNNETELTKTLESKKYKDLIATPEAKYSIIAAMVMAIIQLLVMFLSIKYLYEYIRKDRLSTHAHTITIFIFIIVSVIGGLIVDYINNQYIDKPLIDILAFIFTTISSFIITVIMTLVVQSNYNRKHSFIVE